MPLPVKKAAVADHPAAITTADRIAADIDDQEAIVARKVAAAKVAAGG